MNEGDVLNIVEDHRIEHPSSLDAYKPVLQVTVDGATTRVGGTELNPVYKFTPSGNASYDFFGPHTTTYIDTDAFWQDTTLRELLTAQRGYAQRIYAQPALDISGHQVATPSATLLEETPFIKDAPEDLQSLIALVFRYLLLRHEVGSPDAPSGHFMTILHPETAVFGYILPFSQIPAVLANQRTFDRAIPTLYHELPAFLEERRALEDLAEHSAPFAYLREQVGLSDDDIPDLKAYDQDQLDEAIQTISRNFVAPPDAKSAGRTTSILQMVDWLEEQVGRETAFELLDVPRDAAMHPDKWVSHLLHDIEAGTPPEDIAAHGSYWDTRHGGGTYSQAVEMTTRQRNDIIGDDWQRALHTTHESVTLNTDQLTRTWYSHEPANDTLLEHIRYRLFLQELFSPSTMEWEGQNWNIDLVSTTNRAARIQTQTDDGYTQRPFFAAQYQLQGTNPFSAAMAGELKPTQIGDFFDYDTNIELSARAWQTSGRDGLEQLGFSPTGARGGLAAALDWIAGDGDSGFPWA